MAELKAESDSQIGSKEESSSGSFSNLGGFGNTAALEEEDADEESTEGKPLNLDFLSEVPLDLTVEMGSLSMSIRDVLGLQEGSIIELNKFAGEPMELFINGRLLAHGEIMAVNEKYGFRITDIDDPRAESEDNAYI